MVNDLSFYILPLMFFALFIFLVIFYLKGKADSKLWNKLKALFEYQQPGSFEAQDFVAHYSVKDVCEHEVIREQTFSCKGRNLKESLQGIQALLMMAKEQRKDK